MGTKSVMVHFRCDEAFKDRMDRAAAEHTQYDSTANLIRQAIHELLIRLEKGETA